MSDPKVTPDAEPRVRELLDGTAPSEALDPETAAQLAAWFGAPAVGVGAPDGLPDPSASAPSPRIAAARGHRRRIKAAIDGIDPAFVDQLAHKWTNTSVLVGIRETPPTSVGNSRPSRFNLARWRLLPTDAAREPHAYERPEDIAEALKENTPQAVLRDLNRPEQQWPLRMLPTVIDVGLDIAGQGSLSRARAVIAQSYALRMDDEPIPTRIMSDDMGSLRARIRDEPWEDSYVPPERRAGAVSYVPTAEDLKWFGMIGFDPDL